MRLQNKKHQDDIAVPIQLKEITEQIGELREETKQSRAQQENADLKQIGKIVKEREA